MTANQLLTPQELEDYCPEFIDVVRRVAGGLRGS
jgi:hypothetical protein